MLASPMTHRVRGRCDRGIGLLAGVAMLGTGGCTSYVGALAAETLSAAILNQDDPAIVSAGLPAYLLMVDGFIVQNPDSVGLLAAGAQLFALYGSRFADDAAHGAVLTAKSRRYGERAMCLEYSRACNWAGLDYDLFVAELAQVNKQQMDVLYAYAVSWLSHLDATSSDWSAVGELPGFKPRWSGCWNSMRRTMTVGFMFISVSSTPCVRRRWVAVLTLPRPISNVRSNWMTSGLPAM